MAVLSGAAPLLFRIFLDCVPDRTFTPTLFLRPHEESNLDLELRKLTLYPLSYGDIVLVRGPIESRRFGRDPDFFYCNFLNEASGL